MSTFRAFVIPSFGTPGSFVDLHTDDLPAGEVLVRLTYSSLNYKDALGVTSKGKVLRTYPMVPGIDLAGVVEASSSPDLSPGDVVLGTGTGLGETRWGGYAEFARCDAANLLRIPAPLDDWSAMALGTAGFTAMLGVLAFEDHEVSGKVLVTGAAGGVGSVAVLLLSRLGYEVTASTGRPEERDYLKSLGASEIIHRSELSDPPAKPLLSERWGGVIDTVGGSTLAHVLAEMTYSGCIAACGMAAGGDLSTTVMPFILRGVTLTGLNSSACPRPRRERAWERLASLVTRADLEPITVTRELANVVDLSEEILAGRIRGRTVLKVS